MAGTGMGFVRAQAVESMLLVKPGDEDATPKRAGDFVGELTRYLAGHTVGVAQLAGHITNQTDSAAAWIRARQPTLYFVPPSFFLKFLDNTGGEVVAEVPRFGVAEPHYYLVALCTTPMGLEAIRGGLISAADGFDEDYLRRVVLPADFQPGSDFTLMPSENLADDIYLMMEGGAPEESPPVAVLLDEELKQFFESDSLVWPSLHVVWTSPPVPRDLVVVSANQWTDASIDGLRQVLQSMKDDREGAKLLDLMHTTGFIEPNESLIDVARQKYRSGQ